LRQTRELIGRIEGLQAGLSCRVEVIRTTGDKAGDASLAAPLTSGDTGVFVKEIEQALIAGRIDFAVHSAKDMLSVADPALAIAAFPERENPADALVSKGGPFAKLPERARVGTSSVRRRAQLVHARPDLQVVDLRGNLDTRLKKLDIGQYDAIVIACAGLARMGWESRITEVLGYDVCLPAVGQGALAVECRAGDPVCDVLKVLDDPETRARVTAERAFLAGLSAGCQTPVAALATKEGDRIRLDGLVAAVDGSSVVRASETGDAAAPEAIGKRLAEWFVARGLPDT